MAKKISGYSVRLQAWYRREGRDWIAWAPALHVMTQERTKKGALESLREAIEGWFESCVERGVLAEALHEVGFTTIAREASADSANVVEVRYEERKQPKRIRFDIGGHKGVDYIVGEIPAYIAAHQLGDSARAAA